MAAPVTNQNYTQQINQAFDMLKYATPQQMQVVSQQVQQNPNSPEAMALAMAAQYQQQARAPRPQAPQKTIMEQKLGEFTQTSSQGLPQVGQNQMAMQQAAQKNPMFGAGLAVAPENTEQAPQQMAATGGITALAHGGEVRGFAGPDGSYTGDPLKSLKNLNVDPNDPNLEPNYNLQSAVGDTAVANEALGGTPDASSLQYGDNKYAKDRAVATHKNLLSEAKTKKQAPSEKGIGSLPVAKDQTSMAGLDKYLRKGEVNPSSYDADAAVASMLNSETTPKYSEEPIGKHDILFAPADTSSAARNEASPTNRERKDTIKELLGPSEDYSEEIGMAKENLANASRDKGLGALVGGIGGMLSAQTPYMGQAIGAGLMSGLSSYQSGSKDEGGAQKDLMALQMAHKKALVSGDKEAATILLNNMAEQDKAVALARSKRQDLADKFGYDVKLKNMEGVQGLTKQEAAANQAMALEEFTSSNKQMLEKIKSDIEISGGLKPQHRKDLFDALLGATNDAELAKKLFPEALQLVVGGASASPLGSIGQKQPLGNSNTGYSVSKPAQ